MGLVIHVFLTNIARRSLVFKLCRYVLIWSLNVTYLDLSPVHMHLFTGGGHFLYLCTQMYFGACEGEGGGGTRFTYMWLFLPQVQNLYQIHFYLLKLSINHCIFSIELHHVPYKKEQ